MTVSIRKVGSKWHIRFLAGSGRKRREVIKSLPGNLHRSSVEEKASWYRVEWAMGRIDPFEEKHRSSGTTLGDALDEYCHENLISGNWADTTHRTNSNTLGRIFERVIDTDLADCDGPFFQGIFLKSAGNVNTRKYNASKVNSFLNWMAQKEYLDEPYKVEITMHEKVELRNTEKIKYITWEQLRDVCRAHRWLMDMYNRIYNVHDAKDADFYPDMWWFYFYSLLRAEELPKVRAGDLLTDGRLRVRGKGRRTDIIYLPSTARIIADKYAMGKKDSDPLFATSTNRARKHLGRAVELALGKAHTEKEGGKGFHQLRHGGVVHYLSLGKPIQFVSKLARHRSIHITDQIYGDVINDAMRNAFSDIKHAPAEQDRRSVKEQRFVELN